MTLCTSQWQPTVTLRRSYSHPGGSNKPAAPCGGGWSVWCPRRKPERSMLESLTGSTVSFGREGVANEAASVAAPMAGEAAAHGEVRATSRTREHSCMKAIVFRSVKLNYSKTIEFLFVSRRICHFFHRQATKYMLILYSHQFYFNNRT